MGDRGGLGFNREEERALAASSPYKFGFHVALDVDKAPLGLTEDTVRLISQKKGEPDWMLAWRLSAFKRWLTMAEPTWALLNYTPIDFQAMSFFSAPKQRPKSLEEVDPKILEMYDRLGVPLREQAVLAGVAVDAVLDSVSVATTYKEPLLKAGVIFCSLSEAIREWPDLVRQHIGSVVPVGDNFYAALNAAVFSDGTFVYVPKGVRCPLELSTYFRINERDIGQFERTLIVAEDQAYVSYLEGCTAPQRDENQLHAAVVELVAMEGAQIKYSTVQNWYPGDEQGRGGIYNFVTKRGDCRGKGAKISWTQLETGSAVTWKYPSCLLRGENSIGEFYSVAVGNHHQQVDSGTKMIHLAPGTKSRIVSKSVSLGKASNAYRGLVKIMPGASRARNYTQCDSLLIGDLCSAHTVPCIDVRNGESVVEHEASTSKVGEDQLLYLGQRGLGLEKATALVVNGFCKQVLQTLPLEFAIEAQKLVEISLEGSIA